MATAGPSKAHVLASAPPNHSSKVAASASYPEGSRATGELVVGRRAPAGLMSAPAMAFRRLDFPTPVPPASPST